MPASPMRLGFVAVCLCGAAAAPASAATKLSTDKGSVSERAVRPARVQVGAISYLSGLRWSSWGRDAARGRGRFHHCDGLRPCVTIAVAVRAGDRGWCQAGDLFETLRVAARPGAGRRGRAMGLPLTLNWRPHCGHGPVERAGASRLDATPSR